MRCGYSEGLSPHAGAARREDCRRQWGVSRRHRDNNTQVLTSVRFDNDEIAGLNALWRGRGQDKAAVAALELYLYNVIGRDISDLKGD